MSIGGSSAVHLDEVDDNGLHLVRPRVLVRFTKLFWADLGLRYVYERVQNAAKKRRDVELREIGQRRLADMERHSLELQRRKLSQQRWQAKERRNGPGAAVVQMADSGADIDPVTGDGWGGGATRPLRTRSDFLRVLLAPLQGEKGTDRTIQLS